jgi:hypothetical protein
MAAVQEIDVSALIEQRPITRFQWQTLIVCLSVLFMAATIPRRSAM